MDRWQNEEKNTHLLQLGQADVMLRGPLAMMFGSTCPVRLRQTQQIRLHMQKPLDFVLNKRFFKKIRLNVQVQ